MSQKRGKVFTWPVSTMPTLKANEIFLLDRRKCQLTAKVRLGLPPEELIAFVQNSMTPGPDLGPCRVYLR
jgi:hypothetical protein